MGNEIWQAGPDAIGGVGGSGTKVIARILMELGFYMGGGLYGVRLEVLASSCLRLVSTTECCPKAGICGR